jgi:hypothetical protein
MTWIASDASDGHKFEVTGMRLQPVEAGQHRTFAPVQSGVFKEESDSNRLRFRFHVAYSIASDRKFLVRKAMPAIADLRPDNPRQKGVAKECGLE